MADYEFPDKSEDLGPEVLRANEVILRKWFAPGGRGILTNLRCILLGHPHPVHRRMHWSVDLENVKSLRVEEVTGRRGEVTVIVPEGGGSLDDDEVDPIFGVVVNELAVYVGEPDPCSSLQTRIDDARTQRCISVYGQLVPFQPGPPKHPGNAPDAEPFPVAPPPRAAASADLGAPFVLFVAGEPYRDAVAEQPQQVVLRALPFGSTMPIELGGVHEPGDLRPGQLYGAQASDARYVLSIAKRCGAFVKLVDVDNPGDDAALVQRTITNDDALPCLVRADGEHLSGEDCLTPRRLEAFLRSSPPAWHSPDYRGSGG
jgi:hypothetical protein